eukprot:ctg_2947.g595
MGDASDAREQGGGVPGGRGVRVRGTDPAEHAAAGVQGVTGTGMAGSGEAYAYGTHVESAAGVGADWGAHYVLGGNGRVREGVVTQLGRDLEAAVARMHQLEAELAMERQRLTRLQQLFGGARAGTSSVE